MTIEALQSFLQPERPKIQIMSYKSLERNQDQSLHVVTKSDVKVNDIAVGPCVNGLPPKDKRKNWNGTVSNAVNPLDSGTQRTISTLTSIDSQVIKQKYYTLGYHIDPISGKPAQTDVTDYVPINVSSSVNAWAQDVQTFKMIDSTGKLEDRIIAEGDHELNSLDVHISSVSRSLVSWGAKTSYTIIQLEQMSAGTGISLVQELKQTLKKTWDLDLQKSIFLGLKNRSDIKGLLNMPNVLSNTTTLTKKFSAMTPDEINETLSKCIGAYANVANSTAFPNRLIIPLSDYIAFAGTLMSSTYATVSKLEVLTNAFRALSMDPTAMILPVAYADPAHADGAFAHNRYVLYRHDPETLNMIVPLNYTTVASNMTTNGFSFTEGAMARFSGVYCFRPQEVMYFDF